MPEATKSGGACTSAANERQANLFDQLRTIPHAELTDAVHLGGGGCYVLSPDIVTRNLDRLTGALQRSWPRSTVGWSFKTNYSAELARRAQASGAVAEVVSEAEYRFAQALGLPPDRYIVNGTGRSTDFLTEVLRTTATLIIDSLEELEWIIGHRQRHVDAQRARIGLRIAPQLDFVKTPSRFGIDLGVARNLERARALIGSAPDVVTGVHLHHSGDRSPASFCARLDHLLDATDVLGIQTLAFLDIGGGLGSDVPVALAKRLPYALADLEEYGRVIGGHMALRCAQRDIELILEPGTGLMADAGAFLSPVRAVKRLRDGHLVVIDGTRFAIDPLASSVSPEVAVVRCASRSAGDTGSLAGCGPGVDNGQDIGEKRTSGADTGLAVRLCGNSCMEIDVLHPDIGFLPSIDDIVVIAQKGAYADGMASAFIQGLPGVLHRNRHGAFERVRERVAPHQLSLVDGLFHSATGYDNSV